MDFLTDKFLIPADRFDGPVLVTGAGGCIGAWALAILSRSGISCVAADLQDDRTRPALIMGRDAAADLIWETCDVTDAVRLGDIVQGHNNQAIIHLAGLQVPFCAANPALGARVNVEGTINVLQCAREAGIKRTAYASSVAAVGMPPGGPYKETLYGAYKLVNEHSAYVYWADWQVPSVGIRPNVVYGIARDQGMSSLNTQAIQAAAMGLPFDIPYTGNYSWLYAGEAAAAFIASVSQEGTGAPVFDLNGTCDTIENGMAILRELETGAQVSASGNPFPFPSDLDDAPLRAHTLEYPSISLQDGIQDTHRAFKQLIESGQLTQMPG
ncbi:MAG: SDR family oxidoreductase [Sedimentitalea sp.]|uniref:NAD-dependent epimerase/dehydratase family protein n=1 Tax=Sedimentitalea sp. TaxID=2048915 RepID=UPI003262F123